MRSSSWRTARAIDLILDAADGNVIFGVKTLDLTIACSPSSTARPRCRRSRATRPPVAAPRGRRPRTRDLDDDPLARRTRRVARRPPPGRRRDGDHRRGRRARGTPRDITFLVNPRYESYLADTGASAVIVAEPRLDCPISQLVCAEPYLAFLRCVKIFARSARARPSACTRRRSSARTFTLGEGVRSARTP